MGAHIYNGSNYNTLMISNILSLFTPYDCLICGHEGDLVCAYCLPDMGEPIPSRCYRCQATTLDYALCQKCHQTSTLKHVRIYTQYKGCAQQLIYTLKYGHARDATLVIANCLAEFNFNSQAVLVPIPTATRRRRMRGFDQSELITKHLAQKTGLLMVGALSRSGQSRQVGSKRAQRLEQVQSVFRAVKLTLVKDKTVILVDDVLTTGATIEAAARVLRAAGAKQVDAIIFAQA